MNKIDREMIYNGSKEIIRNYLRLDEDELNDDTHIVNDAGADSLALVELGFQLTEKFGVKISDTSDDKLIFKNLVDYIYQNINDGEG
jgi:acyl carrier protein